jgi:hypothetical protein
MPLEEVIMSKPPSKAATLLLLIKQIRKPKKSDLSRAKKALKDLNKITGSDFQIKEEKKEESEEEECNPEIP